MFEPSLRAQVITRRTYNRPIDEAENQFETWEQTIDRVIGHQRWLWSRAQGYELAPVQEQELKELRGLMLDRKVLVSGRTLWLGGTETAKTKEASQFNCTFTNIETVYDVVDLFSLLLKGAGTGFRPVVGQLTGFAKPINNIEVIPSSLSIGERGNQNNTESWDPKTGVWVIKIGDSADAWARSAGKLLAGKYPAKKLVLDFSEIRPAGERLKGFGWISSGWNPLAKAYEAIAQIMNHRAGDLLTRIDILDVVNWLGTTLSSRRAAQIAIVAYGDDEWKEFATAKKDWWVSNIQRAQSNNSLVFYQRPTYVELQEIFNIMMEAGGSEPGFINAEAATRRAPWFQGVNPCAEILLGNKSFCNLTEVDIGKFKSDSTGLVRAVEIAARANYRQTCVNLRDGILQEAWHLNNEFLRLCGIGLTGIARRPDMKAYDYMKLQRAATYSAYSMADELDMPRPKNVTTIKPSGTLSKIMDTTEGMHKPLGRYIFNNINFSKHDPLVQKCRTAGYKIFENPTNPEYMIVTMPVRWDDVDFDVVDGKEVNVETAIEQLDRYKMLMDNWCQQNVSSTISYSPDEVPSIINWLITNWESYVGVSFIYRTDPSKTAKDIGYLYLPQEVVSKEVFDTYVESLQPLDLEDSGALDMESMECAGGACPVR